MVVNGTEEIKNTTGGVIPVIVVEDEEAYLKLIGETTIDFRNIKPRDENEKAFFKLLEETKCAVYSWGHHCIWAVRDLADIKSENYIMQGDDFIIRTHINTMSAGELVIALLYNGVNVRINYFAPKTKEDMDSMLEGYREIAEKRKELIKNKKEAQ